MTILIAADPATVERVGPFVDYVVKHMVKKPLKYSLVDNPGGRL